MAERLQKILARAGHGSRRQIEAWIEAGRVTVDGAPAHLGQKIAPGQTVRIDNHRVELDKTWTPRRRILLYHKPAGEVCSRRDPQGRPTIFQALPKLGQGRWISVGRLDVATTGLLLVTTDGELAHRLMHPSTGIEREYAVRVRGPVPEEVLQRLLTGVELDDGLARFEDIVFSGGEGANQWYHVLLTEGRYRAVRRLWNAEGYQVSRLSRVRFGPVFLPQRLRPGRWQDLDQREQAALLEAAGMPPEASASGPQGRRRRAK